MKLQIIEHTTDYRGDHDAEVDIAHEYIHGEPIEDLVARVFKVGKSLDSRHADSITIRIVKGTVSPEEAKGLPF